MDQEFIQRATELAKPFWNSSRDYHRKHVNKWNNLNREKLKKCIKKYSLTEKGKIASKKRSANRCKRMKKAREGLTPQEKRDIFDCFG
jgi:hypothetical protein